MLGTGDVLGLSSVPKTEPHEGASAYKLLWHKLGIRTHCGSRVGCLLLVHSLWVGIETCSDNDQVCV